MEKDLDRKEALKEGTFKECYLVGGVPSKKVDRYISRWNNSGDPRTLVQYPDLNAKKEDMWIDMSDEALQELLDG